MYSVLLAIGTAMSYSSHFIGKHRRCGSEGVKSMMCLMICQVSMLFISNRITQGSASSGKTMWQVVISNMQNAIKILLGGMSFTYQGQKTALAHQILVIGPAINLNKQTLKQLLSIGGFYIPSHIISPSNILRITALVHISICPAIPSQMYYLSKTLGVLCFNDFYFQ